MTGRRNSQDWRLPDLARFVIGRVAAIRLQLEHKPT
jgi:hypothetical protein